MLESPGENEKKAFWAGKNAARIDALEKQFGDIESQLRWLNRMVIAVLLGIIVTGLKVFLP